MNTRSNLQKLSCLLVLLPVILACGLSNPAPVAAPNEAPAASPPRSAPETGTGNNPADTIRQWASRAEASSEYSTPEWAASQATGAPNTPDCGDAHTAWASASQDSVEWINLYFDKPVFPTQINIVESYYPDQVSKVELIDMQGQFVGVYTGQPTLLENSCPYTLSIPVSKKDVLAQGVRITLDQSVIGNWNEIDAVEIVGVPGQAP